MFWFALLIWAVATVAYEIIRPKPTFEDARPAGLGDFTFPTATEGRAVPLVWGQCKLNAPNLIWYGNFRKVARTEEVKTGMFSSETVTIGFRYYVGMQMALCLGPVDSLDQIWINDKSVYSGPLSISTTGGISRASLFGGDEHGNGGVSGTFAFYLGNSTEGTDTYLANYQNPLPAYRGVSHVVWRGGWIGNSTTVYPWAFEVTRIPNGLNLSVVEDVNGNTVNEPNPGDCNPMNVLYEILTDSDWGLDIAAGFIDVTNFQAAASTLYDEGNGFSMVIDNATEISTIVQEIQRQIDGSLFFNRSQGQWQVRLARDDYTVGSLTVLDESNIQELKEFTRQTWEETTNQVRIAFTDRDDEYKETFSFAQDPANMEIQGQTVQSDVRYPGVKNATLANDLVWRDLRAMSYPLAKVKLTVNRTMWAAAPGSLFVLNWDRLGISNLVMRVGKINYGNPGDSKIEIFAIQDIFAASTAVYGDPTGSGWDQPTDDPAYATAGNTLVFEAPRQLVVQDPYAPFQEPRAWFSCRYPGDGTVNMRAYTKADATTPPSGSYAEDGAMYGFVVAGTLDAALPAYGSTAARPDNSYAIDINEVDVLDNVLIDGSSGLVSDLTTLIYVNGEFIGFEEATSLGGGQIRLRRIHRGLFSSAPAAHAATSTVWFISQGGALTKRVLTSAQDELRIQLRGVNGAGDETTELETPEIDLHLDTIYLDPLPPRDPYMNTVYADQSISADTSYPTDTGRTGDDARAVKVKVTARDWAVDNPILDTIVSDTWADQDPEFQFSMTLDPGGDDFLVGPYTIDDLSTTPTAFVLRNDMIIACGANNEIPSTARLDVSSFHFVASATRESPEPMTLDITTLSSAIQGEDLIHGAVDNGTVLGVVTYGETGNYSYNIYTALPSSGTLEGRLNGGTWTTIITAGNSTGTLAVTAADTVELRWVTSGPAADQFFTIAGPTAETGYGVLTA